MKPPSWSSKPLQRINLPLVSASSSSSSSPSSSHTAAHPRPLFQLRYSAAHLPPLPAQRILANPRHVLYLPTARRFAPDGVGPNKAYLHGPRTPRKTLGSTTAQPTLWWNVYTPNSVAPKKVVRAWCVRRVKAAILYALAERGLDGLGRRRREGRGKVPHQKVEGTGVERRTYDLVEKGDVGGIQGTAQFQNLDGLVTAPFEEVKRQARVAVDELVRLGEQARQRQSVTALRLASRVGTRRLAA